MNVQVPAHGVSQQGKLTSDDYTLVVRQGPLRAKIAGLKEKDRKPVDPPPIVQLHIRDMTDPAQNYLQSPYYFMCCNLCDTSPDRPTQLKDIDNTDGGFFVFGDLSVKMEGDFRLRFSLFEMLKTEVIYIKSIISDPFTVFAQKNFPGMAESTFLSRSFGDQGVRLRIRKEPRTLPKRPPPPSIRPDDHPRPYLQQSPIDYKSVSSHSQQGQDPSYGPRPYRTSLPDHDEPPSKRRRTLVDSGGRDVYEHDQRYNQPPYTEHRASYGGYPSRNPPGANYGPSYPQGSQSAPGTLSDYSFKHQRTHSSSNSSPYISPRTDISGYSSSAPNPFYQQQPRDQYYPYQQNQYSDVQSRQIPQLSQPVPPYRHHRTPSQPPPGAPMPYTRGPEIDDLAVIQHRNTTSMFATHSNYYQTNQRLPFVDHYADPLPQSRPPILHPPVLPPLESTMTARIPREITAPSRSDYSVPGTESQAFLSTSAQIKPERAYESREPLPFDYASATHRRRTEG